MSRRSTMLCGFGAAFGGDICLAVLGAPSRSALFLCGVACFALAHVLWALAHRDEARPDWRMFTVTAIPLAIFCAVRLSTRLPLVTAMAVCGYSVISAYDLSMAFATRRRFYFLGVLSLVASDVLIGARLLHVPGAGPLIGPLYITAEVLLLVSCFRRNEPRMCFPPLIGMGVPIAFTVVSALSFLVAAVMLPGGGYNPCMRMLSVLGRTEYRMVAYPFCHYFFTLGMVVAAAGTFRIGRDMGAALAAAGLLTIAAVPENVSMNFHNVGCWIAVAGGVVMFWRRRAWIWGAVMGCTAATMGCFLSLHSFKLLNFAPWVPTVQKVLITLFTLFLIFRGRAELPEQFDREAAYRFLEHVSGPLSAAEEKEWWNIGGTQHGIFSRRYHLAFAGYAAEKLGDRDRAGRILACILPRMLSRDVWGYSQSKSYWGDEPWAPDPCYRENVMYTGHLLHLLALYEKCTGDNRYHRKGGGWDFVWKDGRKVHYDVEKLIDVSLVQMRKGPNGGICCEPGLMFFACNNHPHAALRVFGELGYGDWSGDAMRWEKWALDHYLDPMFGGGLFNLAYHVRSNIMLPRGDPGLDGWSLAFYADWASDRKRLKELWERAKAKIDWSRFADPADTATEPSLTQCCGQDAVPPSVAAVFLAAAATAYGDNDVARRLLEPVERRYLVRRDGMIYLDLNREWRIGATAMYFFGCRERSETVDAGWRNVCLERREFPPTKVLWRAADCADKDFRIELREGAEGIATVSNGIVRIEKTNSAGYIVVTAPGFEVPSGTNDVRLLADVAAPDSDDNYSIGFLRAYGRNERLGICLPVERQFFGTGGGHDEMRGLVASAPGMTYRKYAHYRSTDGRVTPVVLVAGVPSVSIWQNWMVEDLPAAQARWKEYFKTQQAHDHAGDRVDEDAFDRALAADTEHTAEVRSVDGVSRLFVDGRPTAPEVYKGKHAFSDGTPAETFAGRALQGAGVKLMVKEIRLGWTPGYRGFWTKDGFDLKGCVKEIKDAMRIADKSLFILAIGCTAYPEFTIDEHPEETWRREDGSVVCGTAGSCTAYKAMGVDVAGGRTWPWVSYSSRVWREAIKEKIALLVAALKEAGLAKRIVGVQLWGYHDAQFTMPIVDYSRPVQEEYRVFLSEPGHSATNYNWFVKQIGFRAQEEFAREFKRAMGKPVIAVRWCQSPFTASASGACDLTAFTRSDALDVLVAQPNYTKRRPGMVGGKRLPTASFHLHGKMYWDEFDLRTYGAMEMWASTGVPSVKGLGTSEDLPMWRTVFRKHAGTMLAQRMGWWFYDMGGGWFSPPEIASDVGEVRRLAEPFATTRPTSWKPGVALVVDEVGQRAWTKPGDPQLTASDLIVSAQSTLFGASGVPFDVYLAEDFLRTPSLAADYRLLAFGFFTKFDAPRRALVDRLSSEGRTILFLAESGRYGGGEATGFELNFDKAPKSCRVVPAEGVAENVTSFSEVLATRSFTGRFPQPLRRMNRMSVKEGHGVKVLARYAEDGVPALAERGIGDGRRIISCEPGGVTPAMFNRFAREAGAFVATRPGVQVDMNGDFASVHCLRPGRYDLRLPRPCQVVNLKTGELESTSDGILKLELTAGETRWYVFE